MLRSFVTYVGPLCLTTTRYHRWVPTAGVRGSCKCSCRHTTPLQVCGSSGSTVITPDFITPPNTPCGCSDVLSYPLVYHTPLAPPASCNLSPGIHKISHPPQDTTSGDDIFKSQMLSPGCVILCQLRYISLHPYSIHYQ